MLHKELYADEIFSEKGEMYTLSNHSLSFKVLITVKNMIIFILYLYVPYSCVQ